MNNFLETAKQYHKAGFRVLPTGRNKRPCNLEQFGNSWKGFREKQTLEDVQKLFSRPSEGIAVLTGINGLECIDVDSKYDLSGSLMPDFLKMVDGIGVDISLLDLTVCQTQNNGWHVLYRCKEIGGNTKLASRYTTEDEKKVDPNDRVKVLFETRGNGGYILVYPTPGYRVDVGKMAAIPWVNQEQRKALLAAARSFDETEEVRVESEPVELKNEFQANDGKTSWDDYNERGSIERLIEGDGWKRVFERGDRVYYRRPGKNIGISGDYIKSKNLFKSWTTSTQLPHEKALTPYALYTHLSHNGNFKESARALFKEGYGDRNTQPVNGSHSMNGQQVNIKEPEKQAEQKPIDIKALRNKARVLRCEKPNANTRDLTYYDKGLVKQFDIGGLGMLGLISGVEKSRKSTLLTALMAAGLSGRRVLGFNLNLHGKKSYWIDTEQPDIFAHSTHCRFLDLAGVIEEHPRHTTYRCRDFSVRERIALIDDIVAEDNVGLIVIDGALDLVRNMNDVEESQNIVQKFMSWTKESSAMILTVIHEGRSEKGYQIGHLGAFLARKCDFNIQTTYDEKDGFTTVRHKLARTARFPMFTFTQDENGYPIFDYNDKADVSKKEEEFSFEEPVTVTETNLNGHRPKMNDDEDIPF